MTRINLLPPERVKERRGVPSQRNYLWLSIVLPLVVLLIMGFWWFSLGSQINNKNEALQKADQDLKDVQAQVQSLQKYATRAQEIATTQDTVLAALGGRVYWARILNNIAIFCPTNIWLVALNGTSAAGTSGSVTFDGYALQCPNRDLAGFFPGELDYHPDYRPIAGWLERMAQIEQFSRVWLASAEPSFMINDENIEEPEPFPPTTFTAGGQWVMHFNSSAQLNMASAAIGTKATAAPASPTPQPSEGEGEAE
ncbi:MAG: hypothetical protein KKF41_07410 [Actinobacteria bacterium]|nr:hypothetical protein [Actinomycetota bacterium]MBU1942254.1 hypothetical protein [Actinomycetota bacterium]MBU2687397.1 hypothetical protein [Actinomycetota bacterium]